MSTDPTDTRYPASGPGGPDRRGRRPAGRRPGPGAPRQLRALPTRGEPVEPRCRRGPRPGSRRARDSPACPAPAHQTARAAASRAARLAGGRQRGGRTRPPGGNRLRSRPRARALRRRRHADDPYRGHRVLPDRAGRRDARAGARKRPGHQDGQRPAGDRDHDRDHICVHVRAAAERHHRRRISHGARLQVRRDDQRRYRHRRTAVQRGEPTRLRPPPRGRYRTRAPPASPS